ncbi:MAG TPA: response regulator [Gemmatimonadales bacterium]|jgi:DNA-binding NtrC family response regulator
MTDVLVVDDDPVARETLEAVLRKAGYNVFVAANAFEAFMELRVRPVHVVVSDVRMPYVEGTNFYHQLSEEFPALAERVVFVTGSSDPRAVATETGRLCLSKPLDPEAVLRTVKAIADRRAPIQEGGPNP